MSNLKIVIAINYLAVGGTQTFAFGLAEGLSQRGHDVYVYDFNLPFHTKSLQDLNSPLLKSKALKFSQFSTSLTSFFLLANKLKPIEIIYTWLTNKIRVYAFRKFVLAVNAEIVSSHLMAADTLSSVAIRNIPAIIHCATMHGSYEGFPQVAVKKKREKVFKRMNGVIFLTPKNITFLNNLIGKNPLLKLKKIYNGYIPQLLQEKNSDISREAFNISPDAFLFIQVARGTEDKGWQQTIEAFMLLQQKTTKPLYIILVGDGPFLSCLKKQYNQHKNIVFYGYSGNPIPLIDMADVGILATYYKGESLPNTIIEYIFSSKPVIASDIGEINSMIGVNTTSPCGFTLPIIPNKGIDPESLSSIMLAYLNDKELYSIHRNNTSIQSEKFKMQTCAESYEAFFLELKQNKSL